MVCIGLVVPSAMVTSVSSTKHHRLVVEVEHDAVVPPLDHSHCRYRYTYMVVLAVPIGPSG